MKKVFKIGCLGIIGLVVLVIIAAVAFGGGDESSTTSTETDSSAPATETADTEEVKVAGIGEEVQVGDATFIINSIETADQVGPSMLPETASGKYVVLDVTYTNGGNEAVMVDTSFFKLKLGEKTYEADAMASISGNQQEDGTIQNAFLAEEINPDSEVTGKVVFDVNPDVAESEDLQLQVQSGLFGTETGMIDLR
ncbi:DUF4352 domain-containing protein [Planococcus citreus]|uniref:Uncharacterized protein DUF4352 n=1 Tax=Planococcus citreus TaxID=1373 RepID=A0A497YGR8_9BACL|nr:DUF4352 domain-containing protein [Planococcus citreus]RLJ90166.1 uncharacterized protein DUF4352 [Planococcus citreus]